VKNAKELRDNFNELYAGVKAGTIKPQTANTLSSIGGRMIQSAVAQTQYYKQRNEIPNIEFLDEK